MAASLLDRAAPASTPVLAIPRARVWALAAEVLSAALASAWAAIFGYLSLVRNLAGGSHAEDLGFTQQTLWNSLHGHLFHMSIYDGAASWNTELNLSSMPRPDSLLAFHFEPMLLGFVPLYAVGGMNLLLVLQACALAAGAIPAFRIARHVTGSSAASCAVAAAYLLSPLGQWAVLADFHTSTFAAPLLLFAVERLVVARKHLQAFVIAAVAVTAREDVAPVVTVLGLTLLLNAATRRVGSALAILGLATTATALAVIHAYSGGVSPFEVRYGPALADPVAVLTRPIIGGYLGTLLLSGGWLAVFAPLALLPALPSLALNVLSSSPWMASGQAHYSALVLPFLTVAVCFALARLRRWPIVVRGASAGLVATSVVGYALAGAGPFAGDYAPAAVTGHAVAAASLASSLPSDAAVSASSSLVPRISERARAYVFPAVLDADYVFLDLSASPAPTSAGDVYLRVQSLLASGDWRVAQNADGLLLLARGNAPPVPNALSPSGPAATGSTVRAPRLLSASLIPSPDGAIDVDGPHWILRTTWQADEPLPTGLRPEFWITLSTGETLNRWDIADVWWNPPDHWPVGEPISIDVPDIPHRSFASWSATWTAP